jgi:hypothetical protein
MFTIFTVVVKYRRRRKVFALPSSTRIGFEDEES